MAPKKGYELAAMTVTPKLERKFRYPSRGRVGSVASAALLFIMVAPPKISWAGLTTSATVPVDPASLLVDVLPRFRVEGGDYRFSLPVLLEKADVISEWTVRPSDVRSLRADLNANGRDEIYLAFETRGSHPQEDSYSLGRWLCLAGFEQAATTRTQSRWQPLFLDRVPQAHFADVIERFEIVGLGDRQALLMQHSLTDYQATPRYYDIFLNLYALRRQNLVLVFEERIGGKQAGGGGTVPRRWIRQIEFEGVKGSPMKEIRLLQPESFLYSYDDLQYYPVKDFPGGPKKGTGETYGWDEERFMYVLKK